MLDGCGCPNEMLEDGWMGVGVGRICPEWLKGGKWPIGVMWPARAAALKGEDFSCMHLDSSSKHSEPFLLFLDLLDIFLFRVWIPSFFMVSGLFTCKKWENQAPASKAVFFVQKEKYLNNSLNLLWAAIILCPLPPNPSLYSSHFVLPATCVYNLTLLDKNTSNSSMIWLLSLFLSLPWLFNNKSTLYP